MGQRGNPYEPFQRAFHAHRDFTKASVSKSTASYHLALLIARGIIEVVESKEGIGGVQMKRYGLKEGSVVTLLSRKEPYTTTLSFALNQEDLQ